VTVSAGAPSADRRSLRRLGLGALLVAALVLIAAAPAAAQRKPIISYVDGGSLNLYDAELGADVVAPPITIPGLVPRYSISLDGRFVLWLDDAVPKRLHLYDRASGQEVPLPGVDVYMNPGGLTVSDTGLIGFDDNSNGPARVYDSAAGAFVATGLDAMNGHRQTRLSGDGRLLATTCVTGCEVDLGSDASAYVQDLAAMSDTGFPDDLTGADDEDEEHPCVNGDGSLVGVDVTNPMQRDIFLYDRGADAVVPMPGLNDPAEQDTSCVLDARGDHVGYLFDNSEFRVYDRASASLLSLPPRPFTTSSTFSAPYPPQSSDSTATVEIAGGKVKLSRKGVVKVELTCPEDEASPPCAGKLRLKTRKRVRFKGRTRKVTLADPKSYSLGAGEVRRVKLKLGKSRLRLVRGTAAARKAVARASVSDAVGNAATVSAKLKLKPKSKGTGRAASAGTTQYSTVFTKFKYKLENGKAEFKGQIGSSKGGCVPDRKVRLYRQKGGDTDKLGGDRTNNKGKFEIELGSGTPKKGKYYAEVKQAEIGSSTNQKTCLSRTSGSVKISG
jgi:hypothetical protein